MRRQPGLILALACLGALAGCREEAGHRPPLRYCIGGAVDSFDPRYGYLMSVGLITQNIYATLVSTALDGKTQGLVAREWTVDEAGRVWRFRIREGLTFDDGTPVTAEAVLQNFRRILWLTRDQGLALNSLLPELGRWKNYAAPLSNVYVEGGEIVFRFTSRPRSLVELLGQPIYGIANPKCFDSHGEWEEPFCSSGAGQYRLERRSPGTVVLVSRHLYPEAKDAPETVEIQVLAPSGGGLARSITAGACHLTVRIGQGLAREDRSFLGEGGLRVVEGPPTGICAVHLRTGGTPFDDPSLRRSVRDTFLALLRRESDVTSELSLDPSFLPKGAMGHLTVKVPDAVHPRVHARGRVRIFSTGKTAAGLSRTMTAVMRALTETLRSHGLTPEPVQLNISGPAARRPECEAMLISYGVFVNDPLADLRRMFMSRIGLLFPVRDRGIGRLIESAEDEGDPERRRRIVEQINTRIFDDASLIAYAHDGLAYIHDPGVDLGRFDLFLDPIEFRAVGWRPTQR